jgi:hypothetical protein
MVMKGRLVIRGKMVMKGKMGKMQGQIGKMW